MSNSNPETMANQTTDNPTSAEALEQLTDEFIEQNSTHKDVIETVISSLEQNNSAMVVKAEKGYLWKFQYGSVEVFVHLTGETDDDSISIWSPILMLPAKDEPGLMRKLLEMNWSETLETRFGLNGDRVVILSKRIVANLAPEEVSRLITLVATIADDNDESLKETFGGA